MTQLDAAQLLLARAFNQTNALAVAEKALKDGVLPHVLMEISRPLNLREGQRLQLAAKAGGTTGCALCPKASSRIRQKPVGVRPVSLIRRAKTRL